MRDTLLIAPHADDEALFAAYLAQQYAAHIIVVYDEGREKELEQATAWLGCPFSPWYVQKGESEDAIEQYARAQLAAWDGARIIAPAEEVAGHAEHNIIARVMARIVHDRKGVRLIRYLTYAPRAHRSKMGVEVEPAEPAHVARKLAALSSYRSQIENDATRPWFYTLLDMREWVAL